MAAFIMQLLYWSPRSSLGNGWVAKTYDEFKKEIRLSQKQVRRIASKLCEKGLLEAKVKRFKGSPTRHYRINSRRILSYFQAYVQGTGGTMEEITGGLVDIQTEESTVSLFTKGQDGNNRKGKMENDLSGKSITKPTTKPTSKLSSERTPSEKNHSAEKRKRTLRF